jgi:hypothetical protein
LNASPLLIGVGEVFYRSIVPYPEENFSACGVGQGHDLSGEGDGEALLILQHRAFALLEQDTPHARFMLLLIIASAQ